MSFTAANSNEPVSNAIAADRFFLKKSPAVSSDATNSADGSLPGWALSNQPATACDRLPACWPAVRARTSIFGYRVMSTCRRRWTQKVCGT